MNLFIYIIFSLLYFIGYIICTNINLIYYQDGSNEELINRIVEEFNDYSQKNDLDIHLIKNHYTSISTAESYSETLEYLFNTRSIKYDLILIDIVDSKKFAKHFSDLKQYLPQSLLEKYYNGIVKETNIIDNNIVTLPLYIEYSMLYSNQDLLDKYNISIPKTWDELIDTAKFIKSEEQNIGNEIIGYVADMTDSENGFSSFYEYIYSFRKELNGPFPVITDPEVEEAMKKLKIIKEEISERGIRSTNQDIYNCLNTSPSNCLFVKAWNNAIHHGNFTLSNIPGNLEGISGSSIGGYNMGINKNISEEKKKSVAKIIEFLTSFSYQKESILGYGYQTALGEIYDNKSICQEYLQCQDFKYIQPILRPIHATEDYTQYSHKYRNFLLQYLYEDAQLQECLQNIEYLTKIFYEEKSTTMNRFFISLIIIAVVFMISCYCLAFTKKHKHKFRLLNRFYWFLYMIGQMTLMCYGLAGMGETTDFKCQIRSIIFSVGFTLGNTILLIRMLINFPESERRFVRFCERNFGKTLIFSLGLDAILNIVALIDPYGVEVIVDGNIMYNKCKLTSTLGLLAIGLIFLYKLLILLAMAILIFIEWNIREFKQDVRYATANLFISFIIYLIFGMVQNMKIGGYRERFFIPAMITYIYGVSCFCVYFVARFFSNYSDETEEAIIKKAINRYQNENQIPASLEKYNSSVSINQAGVTKRLSMADRIMSLHNYGDEIKKSYDVLKSSNNSSMTNLSATRVNLRKNSRSFNNIDDSSMNFNNRRASQATQITAIPENKIADSYGSSSSNFNSNSNPTDSMEQDSMNSDDNNMNRSRTRSIDNFSNLSLTRVNRINSTPNKKFTGYGIANMRSYENFPNLGGLRKGSNVSYSNIHPINGSSHNILSSPRKESIINNYIRTDSNSSITGNKPPTSVTHDHHDHDHIVNMPTYISEKDEIMEGSHQQGDTKTKNNDDLDNNNAIKNDNTMYSINPSINEATSYKSSSNDNESVDK